MDMFARDMTIFVSRSEAFLSADLPSALHRTLELDHDTALRSSRLDPQDLRNGLRCMQKRRTEPD